MGNKGGEKAVHVKRLNMFLRSFINTRGTGRREDPALQTAIYPYPWESQAYVLEL